MIQHKSKSLLLKIKPKIYKNKLFIGDKVILKLTIKGVQKLFLRLLWIICVVLIVLLMVFGGFVIRAQSTPSVDQQILLP